MIIPHPFAAIISIIINFGPLVLPLICIALLVMLLKASTVDKRNKALVRWVIGLLILLELILLAATRMLHIGG